MLSSHDFLTDELNKLNDENDKAIYSQLINIYQAVKNILITRNALLHEKECNAYTQAVDQKEATPIQVAFFQINKPVISSILEELKVVHESTTTAQRKMPQTLLQLQMACASLFLQLTFLGLNTHKDIFLDWIKIYEIYALELYGKKIFINDNHFNYDLYVGLNRFFSFHLHDPNKRLNSDQLLHVYDKLLQTISLSMNKKFATDALSTVHALYGAHKLIQFKLPMFDGYLKLYNQAYLTVFDGPVENIDELNKKNAAFGYILATIFIYTNDAMLTKHKQFLKHTNNVTKARNNTMDQIIDRYTADPGAMKKTMKLAQTVLDQFDKFKLIDSLILDGQQIKEIDKATIISNDYANSYLFTAARNLSFLFTIIDIIKEPLCQISATLTHFNLPALLKIDNIHTDEYKTAIQLLTMKYQLLQRSIEQLNLMLKLKALLENDSSLFPKISANDIIKTQADIYLQSIQDKKGELIEVNEYLTLAQEHKRIKDVAHLSIINEYHVFSQALHSHRKQKPTSKPVPATQSVNKKKKQPVTTPSIQKTSSLNPHEIHDQKIEKSINRADYESALNEANLALKNIKDISLFDHAACLARLAYIYTLKKSYDEARKNYDAAIGLCQASEDTDDQNFGLLLQDEASKIGLMNVRIVKKHLREAREAQRQYQFQKAIDLYLAIKPQDNEIKLQLANCYDKMGQTQKSIELLSDSDDIQIQLHLATYHLNLNNTHQATELFNKLNNLNQKPTDWTRHHLKFLFKTHQYKKLKYELMVLENKNKNNQLLPIELFELAWYSFKIRRDDEATEHFENLERITPNHPIFTTHYCIHLAHSKKYDEALKRINANYLPGYICKIEILSATGKFAEAIDSINTLIHKYQDYLKLKLVKCKILKENNKINELKVLLKELAEQFPHHPECKFYDAQLSKIQVAPKVAPVQSQHINYTMVTLPDFIRTFMLSLSSIGSPYLYGKTARLMINHINQPGTLTLEKISICLFTDNKNIPALPVPNNPNLYFTQINNLLVYIIVKPAKMNFTEFALGLDTQASALLIDANGTIEDPLKVREKIPHTSRILPSATTLPILILHHIRHNHENGTTLHSDDINFIKRLAPTISKIPPKQLLVEIRKVASRGCFENILKDWIELGILNILLPELSPIDPNLLLSIASSCDQLPKNNPSDALIYFFSHVVSSVDPIKLLDYCFPHEIENIRFNYFHLTPPLGPFSIFYNGMPTNSTMGSAPTYTN